MEEENLEIREKFQKKDILWCEYYKLIDGVKLKSFMLDSLMKEILILILKFLKKYDSKDDLEEVIIAFESLKNNLLFSYGDSAKEIYENDILGDILESFDSRIFEFDYEKEINTLKSQIENYLRT